jgi:UDP-N-acetylglucosamine--N-acetylmuramyl-(pentapeptide) pyrophosphoryl-undecaprenol N-acetylglucosamine transferase
MPAGAPDKTSPGEKRRLVIAGGATGGHLFPGIAVAQAFRARCTDNQVLFVNAGRDLEVRVLTQTGWEYRVIDIEGIKGRTLWRQIAAGVKIPKAVWSAARVLRSFRPDIVLGVGGYSAGPVVVAAWVMGIATALHEQNRLPGTTNKWVGRLVDRIYLSFQDDDRRFNARKVLVTGNPVRDEILNLEPAPAGDVAGFTVLIIGGSQGAHAINEAVVTALPHLKQTAGLRMIHQTGPTDEEPVRRAYAESGMEALVQAFYNDIADQYRQADLIIARAGATTVAETTAIGKPAIFIPFPHATDDHQTHNARALVAAGAAELIRQEDLNGEMLASRIIWHAQNRSQLARMAANARALGRPGAAAAIVDDIYALLSRVDGGRHGKVHHDGAAGHRQESGVKESE